MISLTNRLTTTGSAIFLFCRCIIGSSSSSDSICFQIFKIFLKHLGLWTMISHICWRFLRKALSHSYGIMVICIFLLVKIVLFCLRGACDPGLLMTISPFIYLLALRVVLSFSKLKWVHLVDCVSLRSWRIEVVVSVWVRGSGQGVMLCCHLLFWIHIWVNICLLIFLKFKYFPKAK